MFKRLGNECDVASDGEEALRLIEHQLQTREHRQNERHRMHESLHALHTERVRL